ncbi:aldehyde dehydrogenase family protein [Mycobacterium lepromatosis]|uniref:Aldehyde dehydrogenase n=1 Tax=Mycobacterium lepromatosis TaxID=480418 RepID=A0A0F4ENX5_9MYCO|nr:aldehyde dehydrogenase family protein [Mycobacterium lepromatosis]KJX74504.1 aldehyde dehydrogenase [Mycobacterium lepromatosis]UKN42959.1 aldehyde dehydrogenase family protein [Mycobacterium lepromatosis]
MSKSEVPPHAPPAVDSAAIVARLRQTFASGRTRSVDWRTQQLRALQALMTENEGAIAQALADDLDRNPVEAFIVDIATTVSEAKYAAKKVRKWMRRTYRLLEVSQFPGRGWVEYEPYGTVLIIGAWNYPFYLTLAPAVGAIAAGNTMVLKPSEIAAASAHLMAELVPCYLDTDAIVVVEGGGAVSQELIAQGLDRVMFTGGTEIGREVYEGAAAHLTPVTLELGGKSPVIVAADADIDVAAKRIAWIKILNAGQTCVAPDYVLADATIRDELVNKICLAITKFRSQDDPSGMRIVNQRQFDRLCGYLAEVQSAVGGKGAVAVGGKCNASTLRIQPTVVVDPDLEGPLMTKEIFGPILPVLTVQSLDEAIIFINARPKPLAAYLFTKSRKTRARVIEEVSAGGMLVNHLAIQVLTAKLPFGGVGASGIGAYHGKWGFDEFSHRKSVLTKPTRPDFSSIIYPPYTERSFTFKLARRLF